MPVWGSSARSKDAPCLLQATATADGGDDIERTSCEGGALYAYEEVYGFALAFSASTFAAAAASARSLAPSELSRSLMAAVVGVGRIVLSALNVRCWACCSAELRPMPMPMPRPIPAKLCECAGKAATRRNPTQKFFPPLLSQNSPPQPGEYRATRYSVRSQSLCS